MKDNDEKSTIYCKKCEDDVEPNWKYVRGNRIAFCSTCKALIIAPKWFREWYREWLRIKQLDEKEIAEMEAIEMEAPEIESAFEDEYGEIICHKCRKSLGIDPTDFIRGTKIEICANCRTPNVVEID